MCLHASLYTGEWDWDRTSFSGKTGRGEGGNRTTRQKCSAQAHWLPPLSCKQKLAQFMRRWDNRACFSARHLCVSLPFYCEKKALSEWLHKRLATILCSTHMMQSSCKLDLLGVLKLSLWPVCMTRAKLQELTRESFSSHFPFELAPIFFLIYYRCPVQTALLPSSDFLKNSDTVFLLFKQLLFTYLRKQLLFSPDQLGHFHYKTQSFLCKLQLSL